MGTLASVFEQSGLATVAISIIREQIETTQPPRALHCEFPLGRPLGKPGDSIFQHQVLDAAFDLLKAESGPVLVDYPEEINDDADVPLSCTIPLADDSDKHPAEAEARGLLPVWRRSYEKYGRTTVGKVVTPEQIPEIITLFARIADGEDWTSVGLPGDPTKLGADIKNFYEEASLSLSDGVPGARQAETWFVTQTKAGDVIQRARIALEKQEAGSYFTTYILPMTQVRDPEGDSND